MGIACQEANPMLPGASIDIGCSVGRGSFALAERTKDLVLGVDLNFAMLRLASEVLRRGKVKYARRRVGLVYHRREFPARFANHENVDFWACDAAALPFPAATFSLAMSMNTLDCMYDPREFLASISQALKQGGKAVVACPYDWSGSVTAMEAWLGGHSQRSPVQGSCETILRSLLTPGAHPNSIDGLKLIAERDNLPWQVRLHDRSTMAYKLHMVVAEKQR
jgi:SAM-dependent methyltransferase